MVEISPQKLREYMRDARAAVNALNILPRTTHRYVFDHVALEIVSKAFSIAEASLVLIDAGYHEEAYGMCRSAVECALQLRYLTSEADKQADRSSVFVAYSFHYKNFWTYYARPRFIGKPQEAAIEREVKRWNLTGDPKPVRNWAKLDTWKAAQLNHPLDAEFIDHENKSLSYAINYFQPSQYVHCSQPALDGFVPDEGVPFSVASGKPWLRDVPERVSLILLVSLHRVIVYALYGMHVDVPAAIGNFHRRALGMPEMDGPR